VDFLDSIHGPEICYPNSVLFIVFISSRKVLPNTVIKIFLLLHTTRIIFEFEKKKALLNNLRR